MTSSKKRVYKGRGRGTIATKKRLEVQAKAKAAFLTLWRDGWSVRKCAEAAKVERTTIWRWRQQDQAFDRLYRVAREDGIDVFRDIAHEEARQHVSWAVALVLKMKGALPGDVHWEGDQEETTIGAAFTVEDLAQRAVERGYVTAPRPVKEIDGAGIVKVT